MSAGKRVRALVEMDLNHIRGDLGWSDNNLRSIQEDITRMENNLSKARERLAELRQQETELLQWLVDNPE